MNWEDYGWDFSGGLYPGRKKKFDTMLQGYSKDLFSVWNNLTFRWGIFAHDKKNNRYIVYICDTSQLHDRDDMEYRPIIEAVDIPRLSYMDKHRDANMLSTDQEVTLHNMKVAREKKMQMADVAREIAKDTWAKTFNVGHLPVGINL